MKKYIILYVILLLTGIIGCKKELIEKPYLISKQNFYNTKEEADAGIAAVYPGLRTAFGAIYLLTTESSTDIFKARDSWGQISLFEGLQGANRTATEGF